METEEQLLREMVVDYVMNHVSKSSIDFEKQGCKDENFINLINCCRIPGIAFNFAAHKCKNMPIKLFLHLKTSYACSIKNTNKMFFAAKEFANFARQKAIKVVFGGDYIFAKEIYGLGDLHVNKLIVYADKKINIDKFSEIFPIELIIKDDEFFNKYYNESVSINQIPLYLAYQELEKEVKNFNSLTDNLINMYMIRMYYVEFHVVKNYFPKYKLLDKFFFKCFSA